LIGTVHLVCMAETPSVFCSLVMIFITTAHGIRSI
jgi:hypothetical protein